MKIKTTHSAGGVVIQKKTRKIVIVEQKNFVWSLPKGHVEPGEDPLTAACREIQEESGIQQLEYIKELGMYQRYKLGPQGEDVRSELKSIIMFLFETTEKKLQPEDPEHPSAIWVGKYQVPLVLTHVKDKEFFEKVLADELQKK